MIFYYNFFSLFFFFYIYICISISSHHDRIDFLTPNSHVESEPFQQFYLRAKLVNCRITNELPRHKYFHKAKLVRGWRGFVSLGIIVSKLQVRYFQPGIATSPSIVLPFLFSYVFHFPGDHAFNNRPWLRANLVTKKTRNFPDQRTFLKRSAHFHIRRFPAIERFYASVQTRTAVNTCRQTMKSNGTIVQQ